MSVKLPNRPTNLFEGEVELRQGVPAMKSGSATVDARREVRAAILRTASMECRARTPSERGTREDRDGK